MSYAVGQELEFTANVSGGTPPYSYSWSFGDGTTASTNPAYHTYSSAGTYTATVKVTDSEGNSASHSATITILSPVSQLIVKASASPSYGYAPLTVYFAAYVSGGHPPYTYEWDFGDGYTSSSPDTFHTYTKGGTYTATVKVTDSIGETGSASTTVTIVQEQTITIKFEESGLPEGASWSVNLSGHTYSATAPDPIEVTLPAGSYNWTANEVSVVAGRGVWCFYTPVLVNQSGTIASSTTVSIVYANYKCIEV